MNDLANWIIVPIGVLGVCFFGMLLASLEKDREEGYKHFVLCLKIFIVTLALLVLWINFLPTN